MMERTAERGAALVDELRNVVAQAEALLEAIARDKDEALSVLRERMYAALDAAKDHVGALEQEASVAARRASVAAAAFTRENPWTVVGGALALGLTLGSWLTRALRADDDVA
jgi:ElaB/YqjD/DUF883 family membrane-anchored ribosome-binding protein